MKKQQEQLERDGFFPAPSLLSFSECNDLILVLGLATGAGRRGVLAIPEIRGIALSEKVLAIVRPNVFGAPKLVRGIYFDKGPDAN